MLEQGSRIRISNAKSEVAFRLTFTSRDAFIYFTFLELQISIFWNKIPTAIGDNAVHGILPFLEG